MQYFTLPHIIHMDSSGLQWTPLDFTIYWTISHTQHKTGLHWTGLDWTYKYGLHWTGLDFQTQIWTPLGWTGLSDVPNTNLDSTGLSAILSTNWTPLDFSGLSTILPDSSRMLELFS
ncbi:hypothetical protein K443DRAFT_92808 [Laccaria amethystina LaAM-08-1]|uniref:Uncharacterized protein n=1 Tax=Laccaria amethystina LaAM-08-1 TaxID=1095629 RepID=A0A0C9Y3F2_9AGAR|nr:hypothetical protein K443DRAFT_92808 [Laccaria amethystina LaAM-08-1]